MNYYAVERSDSLSHFGIHGMRWGVRRFQNKDGSLTAAGKKRRYKALLKTQRQDRKLAKKLYKQLSDTDKQWLQDEKREKKESGVKSGLFSDRIKPGSQIVRFTATENEPIDSRRKYASVLKDDVLHYKYDAGFGLLGFNPKNGFYRDTYEPLSRKGIKVVKPDVLVKDLVKKYGDIKDKDSYKIYSKNRLREQMDKSHKGLQDKNSKDYDGYDYAIYKQKRLAGFFNKILKDETKMSEIRNRYSKKGYDAVVDPEDYVDGYSYPLIVFDPKKSLKRTKTEKVS